MFNRFKAVWHQAQKRLRTFLNTTVRRLINILTTILFLTACNQINETSSTDKQIDTTNSDKPANETTINIPKQTVKRLSFKNILEIDTSYTIWVEKQKSSDAYSLSLHFMYKDTLTVAYSPECWLIYPYKIEHNKMLVYWDTYIDTKYEFDIVKAIDKIDKKFIGKNFMTLELINDTTLKATYLIEEIRKKVNSSNKERKLFPDKFNLVQAGEIYD